MTQNFSRVLYQDKHYRNMMLFGVPMIQANAEEHNAPPFGVAIHESCKIGLNFNSAMKGKWLQENIWPAQKCALLNALRDYFTFYKNHIFQYGYPLEKIKQHEAMMEEYLR